MKQKLILCLLFLFATLGSYSNKNNFYVNASETVYICTGPKAKKYHKTSHCKGLNRCSGTIKSISIAEARKHYSPCNICY